MVSVENRLTLQQRLQRIHPVYFALLHLLLLLSFIPISIIGIDTLYYLTYMERFYIKNSARGSYGPLFYLFYTPVYYLFYRTTDPILGLIVVQSLNIICFLVIDIIIWKMTKNRICLIVSILSSPVIYGVSLIWDQRNDVLVTVFIVLSLYYFSRDKNYTASLFVGIATAIKWIPALGLFPYIVYAVRKTEKDRREQMILLVKLLFLSTLPIVIGTAFLYVGGYQHLAAPYLQHLHRRPRGNNLNYLLFIYFHNELLNFIVSTILLVIFFIFVLYISYLAYNSEDISYLWVTSIFYAFLATSKVSNNQFFIWLYFPLILTQDKKYIVLMQIHMLILVLTTAVDSSFLDLEGAFWHYVKLILLFSSTILYGLNSVYLLRSNRMVS
ncbi:MAG: DUF2029 domain-containing protein [Candidatus Heimdallarchaeota archaeon]|nr:DUF2029 domain-containing protein [Candidatus Heimdallarchaeota archaeon]